MRRLRAVAAEGASKQRGLRVARECDVGGRGRASRGGRLPAVAAVGGERAVGSEGMRRLESLLWECNGGGRRRALGRHGDQRGCAGSKRRTGRPPLRLCDAQTHPSASTKPVLQANLVASFSLQA